MQEQDTQESAPLLPNNDAAEAIEQLEDMVKLEKLFKGVMITSSILLVALICFYFTLKEELRIHIMILIFFTVGLMASA